MGSLLALPDTGFNRNCVRTEGWHPCTVVMTEMVAIDFLGSFADHSPSRPEMHDRHAFSSRFAFQKRVAATGWVGGG